MFAVLAIVLTVAGCSCDRALGPPAVNSTTLHRYRLPAPQPPGPPAPVPTPTPSGGPPPIVSIVVTPNPATVAHQGLIPFHADCVDVNQMHVPCPSTLTWSVTDSLYGEILPPGLFRGLNVGSTKVRARVGSVFGSVVVTVTP